MWHQPRNKSVDEESGVGGDGGSKEGVAGGKRTPPSSDVLSISQNKPSKFQGDFSCPQVLHPVPSCCKQHLGVPQIGTLGRSILPALLPQQEWLPAGMKDGGSSSQRRLGWAGREAPGGDRAQLPWQAGSTPVGTVTRRERGDIVASVPPTTLLSGTQRAWEICPHLPRLCSGRWENAHGSTWGGGWGS